MHKHQPMYVQTRRPEKPFLQWDCVFSQLPHSQSFQAPLFYITVLFLCVVQFLHTAKLMCKPALRSLQSETADPFSIGLGRLTHEAEWFSLFNEQFGLINICLLHYLQLTNLLAAFFPSMGRNECLFFFTPLPIKYSRGGEEENSGTFGVLGHSAKGQQMSLEWLLLHCFGQPEL